MPEENRFFEFQQNSINKGIHSDFSNQQKNPSIRIDEEESKRNSIPQKVSIDKNFDDSFLSSKSSTSEKKYFSYNRISNKKFNAYQKKSSLFGKEHFTILKEKCFTQKSLKLKRQSVFTNRHNEENILVYENENLISDEYEIMRSYKLYFPHNNIKAVLEEINKSYNLNKLSVLFFF